MQLGLLTAILDEFNLNKDENAPGEFYQKYNPGKGFADPDVKFDAFRRTIDFAAANGFPAIELAAWPVGKSDRRYAGVMNLDVEAVLACDEFAKKVVDYSTEKGVKVASLGYYSNPLTSNLDDRAKTVAHLNNLVDAAAKLGVNMVTTFVGRDQWKTVDANLPLVKEIWTPILSRAAEKGVKIAIENCPMWFGDDQWPGGQNIMTSPANWEKVFDVLPFDNFGINYDPSHCIWQHLDVVRPIYEFKEKMFFAHAKDIRLNRDKMARCGITANPLDYMKPVLPGRGDVPWGAFFAALSDIGYDGVVAIEIEDKAFEGSFEAETNAIRLTKRYLNNFII